MLLLPVVRRQRLLLRDAADSICDFHFSENKFAVVVQRNVVVKWNCIQLKHIARKLKDYDTGAAVYQTKQSRGWNQVRWGMRRIGCWT